MAGRTGLGATPLFGSARLLDDPARLELLAPDLLRAEAAAAGLHAARAAAPDRTARLLDHARLLREHGERAGAPESLARAARQADAAGGAAGAMEAAVATLAAAVLAGDGALLDAAEHRLAEAPAVADPAARARLACLSASLAARRALAEGSAEAGMAAAARCDAAILDLARLHRRRSALLIDLARGRMDRAELLIGFALRLRDTAPAFRAAEDMRDLIAHLPADRLPVLHARCGRLLGEALTAEGELSGRFERLAEAARVLQAALEGAPHGHAPVERARLGRALGRAAAAMGAACEEAGPAELLLDAAASAFDAAVASLEGAAVPTLAAQLAFERAGVLAARALRPGAGRWALAVAEAALRDELRRVDGEREPAAWAAVQVALVRLYMADEAPRLAEATLAGEAALDVFAELGLATLAAEASALLKSLQPA